MLLGRNTSLSLNGSIQVSLISGGASIDAKNGFALKLAVGLGGGFSISATPQVLYKKGLQEGTLKWEK